MFGVRTFRGGIHPDDQKKHSEHLEIEALDAPQTLVYPVVQHIGAPAACVVQKGDCVKAGQLLAAASGFVSANVHASVSGTVTDIRPYLHPNGTMVQSVLVENDFAYTPAEGTGHRRVPENMSRQELLDAVREAGIVGMGGAAFPTHVKLSPPPDKSIDVLLVNGAECEPYLTSDHRVMLEHPACILFGLRCVMRILGVERCCIGIENNKPDAIEKLTRKAADVPGVAVVPVRAKYPQGSEKHLIYALTGREVPPGALPADVGVVVMNIDTVCAVADAVQKGLPLTERIVTVGGSGVKASKNFRVRIGTPVQHVLDAAGGLAEETVKILLGGPMMGIAIYDTSVPVIKGTGAVLALTEADVKATAPTACLRCGKCADACPMGLQPYLLRAYAIKEDAAQLQRLHVTDCIECGACAYICPGRQQPVQYIRLAKAKALAERKEKEAAK